MEKDRGGGAQSRNFLRYLENRRSSYRIFLSKGRGKFFSLLRIGRKVPFSRIERIEKSGSL